jgi:ATP-dependent phosphoenolpyruvate carboxykinase
MRCALSADLAAITTLAIHRKYCDITTAASAPTRLAYDKTAAELAARFEENFKQFDASEAIRSAGPKAK